MGERRVHVREVLEAEATGFELKLTRGVTEKNERRTDRDRDRDEVGERA